MDEQRLVSRSRRVNMFGELSAANRVLLENAQQKRAGYHFEYLSCIIVTAFKYEAFLNHLACRVLDEWSKFDRQSYRKKQAQILTHIGLCVLDSRRPFQTLAVLFEARNELAHGKAELLIHDSIIEHGDIEQMRRRKPLTKWEELCTLEFITQAYDDTEEIAELMWKLAGFDLEELRFRGHSYEISRNDLT